MRNRLGLIPLHFSEGTLERMQAGADGAAQIVDAKCLSEVRLEVAFDGPDDPQPLCSAWSMSIRDAGTRKRLRESREQLLLRPFDFGAGHGLGRVAVGPDDLPDVGDDMPQVPSLCVGDRNDPRLAGHFDAESLEQRAPDLERDPLGSGRQAEVELLAFRKEDHVGRTYAFPVDVAVFDGGDYEAERYAIRRECPGRQHGKVVAAPVDARGARLRALDQSTESSARELNVIECAPLQRVGHRVRIERVEEDRLERLRVSG